MKILERLAVRYLARRGYVIDGIVSKERLRAAAKEIAIEEISVYRKLLEIKRDEEIQQKIVDEHDAVIESMRKVCRSAVFTPMSQSEKDAYREKHKAFFDEGAWTQDPNSMSQYAKDLCSPGKLAHLPRNMKMDSFSIQSWPERDTPTGDQVANEDAAYGQFTGEEE